MATGVSPYGEGITAGHAFYVNAVATDEWEEPESPPRPMNADDTAAWWRGFHHGESDAQAMANSTEY